MVEQYAVSFLALDLYVDLFYSGKRNQYMVFTNMYEIYDFIIRDWDKHNCLFDNIYGVETCNCNWDKKGGKEKMKYYW